MAIAAMKIARNNGSVPMERGDVTAAQAWNAGAVLIDGGAGTLSEAADDPVAAIVGVSVTKEPPTNVTSDNGMYIPAIPGVEFEASVALTADVTTGSMAQTDVYATFNLKADSNIWYVDITAASTTGAAVIVGLVDPIGTVNGRVRIRINPTTTIYTDGAA